MARLLTQTKLGFGVKKSTLGVYEESAAVRLYVRGGNSE